MGQAVKYALLAAALLAIVALIVVYVGQIPVSDTVAAFASTTTSFISTVGSYLTMAKGFLNALVGFPTLVNMCLWFTLLMPFAKWGIHLITAVYRWINQ